MNQKKKVFSKAILQLENVGAECNRIASKLHHDIFDRLHRIGGVVGISGGIDSSVTLALTVKAFGANKCSGVMLPEKDSSPDSARLARNWPTNSV